MRPHGSGSSTSANDRPVSPNRLVAECDRFPTHRAEALRPTCKLSPCPRPFPPVLHDSPGNGFLPTSTSLSVTPAVMTTVLGSQRKQAHPATAWPEHARSRRTRPSASCLLHRPEQIRQAQPGPEFPKYVNSTTSLHKKLLLWEKNPELSLSRTSQKVTMGAENF